MTDRALFLSLDAAIGRKITDKAMITLEIAAPARITQTWAGALHVSYFAQIPDGQRRKRIIVESLSQSVRTLKFKLNRNPCGYP